MIPSQTLLQQETPQGLMGRVSSSLMSLLAVSQVFAMFVAGRWQRRPASAISTSEARSCWSRSPPSGIPG